MEGNFADISIKNGDDVLALTKLDLSDNFAKNVFEVNPTQESQGVEKSESLKTFDQKTFEVIRATTAGEAKRKVERFKKEIESQQDTLHLQAALEALEMRKDKDNKADAQVTQLMQIKDKAIIEERILALFKLKNKEMSAVTEIKGKEHINTTNQLSVHL